MDGAEILTSLVVLLVKHQRVGIEPDFAMPDGQVDHRALGPDRTRGGVQALLDARAVERDLDAVALANLVAPRHHVLLGRVDEVRRAVLLGKDLPLAGHLGGDDGARAERRQALDHGEADGAGAEHEDLVAGLDVGDGDGVPCHC